MKRKTTVLLAALLAASLSGHAIAQKNRGGTVLLPPPPPPATAEAVYQSWMSPEIQGAWTSGYKGQGVTITVVDDFTSATRYSANLGTGSESLRHGEWTRKEAGMIAPSASMRSHDYYARTSVTLGTGFNVLNLSYGMMAPAGYASIAWSAQESSIISHAAGGRALVVKSAGNDGVAVGQPNAAGRIDYLGRDLIGKPSAIFVGALSRNGTTATPASMASYSNLAGDNTTVQAQYLVVGVESGKTGLAGTSFAAPIVAGYAAVLSSKFTSATPTQVTNQLLATARQDTVLNYRASIHGRGEASIARALSPVSIR